MLKVGNVVASWLEGTCELSTEHCCGVVSCLNAWPLNSIRQHLRTISFVLVHEAKLDQTKIALVKLLIATAVKHVERANKKS